jgi:cold shock CspA family protein
VTELRPEEAKGVIVITQGRVDWYSANLGHGFILSEDGATKAFVRHEDIVAGEEENLQNNDRVSVAGEEENLQNNDRVSCEVAQGMEGPEARNVSRG